MKQLLLICAVVALVGGCASTPKVVPNSPEAKAAIEAAIRKAAKKPTGELTQADLEKVTKLNLYDNQLTDLKGLEKLTQLTQLSLYNNQLTDLTGLEKLTQLRTLHLGGNPLTDLTRLEKLTQLTYLSISNSQLTKLTDGVEKLTQLENLDLGDNKLTDVKGLKKLTNLTTLFLFNNPALTKAQIAELQKALPNCQILSDPTK